MHFWQLAISSLPELAIVKWTFSWFWRVVWFSLDANSVIYLLFVAKKYLLVFFVTCISLLFSMITFWIVDQLKIVMKGEGFKRKKERKKDRGDCFFKHQWQWQTFNTRNLRHMAIKSTPRQHYVKVKIEKEIEKLAPIIATTAITGNHNANDSLNSRRVAF